MPAPYAVEEKIIRPLARAAQTVRAAPRRGWRGADAGGMKLRFDCGLPYGSPCAVMDPTRGRRERGYEGEREGEQEDMREREKGRERV